jgi:hypothetical protein
VKSQDFFLASSDPRSRALYRKCTHAPARLLRLSSGFGNRLSTEITNLSSFNVAAQMRGVALLKSLTDRKVIAKRFKLEHLIFPQNFRSPELISM